MDLKACVPFNSSLKLRLVWIFCLLIVKYIVLDVDTHLDNIILKRVKIKYSFFNMCNLLWGRGTHNVVYAI